MIQEHLQSWMWTQLNLTFGDVALRVFHVLLYLEATAWRAHQREGDDVGIVVLILRHVVLISIIK